MDSFLSLKKRHITLKVVLYYVPLLLNQYSEKEKSPQKWRKMDLRNREEQERILLENDNLTQPLC